MSLKIRELSFHAGQRELKYRAARVVRFRPQPASVGIDDRPADRKPHPGPTGLGSVESLEDALDMFRIDASPGIMHGDKDTAGFVLRGADRQLSCPCLRRAHRFECVEDQI